MTQTLSYLNGISSAAVTFTDNRASGVVFDRVAGKAYSFTETVLSFPVYIGANIVEIINPSVALVRYKITLGTTQASLNWPSLPTGAYIVQDGTQYTLYGINSVADWELVRAPTITLDPLFSGSFSYTADIVYNTDTTADNEFGWSVGTYIPTALMQTSASVSCVNSYIGGATTNINANFQLGIVGVKVLGIEFNLEANATATYNGTTALASAFTIAAKARSFEWADETTIINNPTPDTANENFGAAVGVNASSQLIISADDTTYAAYVTNSNGTIFQSIARRGTSGSPSVKLIAQGAYLAIKENNPGTDEINLYKFTSGTYSLIDTLDTDLDTNDTNSCLNNDYLIVSDATPNGDNGTVEVYSHDDTTGFSLEYTINGATQPGPYGQRLGRSAALNDTYFVIVEDVPSGATITDHHKLFVYDLATGTLQRTINNDISIKQIEFDGDEIIAVGSENTILSWDVTDGSSIMNHSGSPDPTAFNADIIRILDSSFIGIRDTANNDIQIINRTSGTIQSTISDVSGTGADVSDFQFYGDDVLIVGMGGFTDTSTNEGVVYIKKET